MRSTQSTWLLTTLLLVLLPPATALALEEQAPEVRLLLDVDELIKSSGVWQAIDLRPVADYSEGRIPGAVHLRPDSLDSASAQGLRVNLGKRGLRSDVPIVLYGETSEVGEVAQMFLALEQAGASSVTILRGGYAAWSAAGQPTDQGTTPGGSTEWRGTGQAILVEPEWLLDRFGRRGVEVLDVRDGVGWGAAGEAPPLFRSEHVPHALPFAIRSVAGPDAQWPDPDEAFATFVELGPRPHEYIDPAADFVVYGSGLDDPNVASGYLLLRLMGREARVLRGGWPAWKAASLPTVRIIDAAETRELLGHHEPRPLVVDLRQDWDHRQGRLPNAYWISHRPHTFDERLERLAIVERPGFDRTKLPIVFYCFGRDCARSRECASIAAQSGFRKLYWFRDAMDGWREAGFELAYDD